MKKASEQYDIIELIVREIEVYLEKARSYFNGQPTDESAVVSGFYSFGQNIYFRIKLTSSLLQFQGLSITDEQIDRLWLACCRKTKGSIQKRSLISYLYHDIVPKHFFPC